MTGGFPHSEISGSKVVWHLPEAYRSYTASFIVILSLGIHHMLLIFLLGNLKTTITYIYFLLPCFKAVLLKLPEASASNLKRPP